MPRQHKRKSSEVDLGDPMAFVRDYCKRYDLPFEIGNSLTEKECVRRADEAREDYKSRRAAAPASGSTSPNASNAPSPSETAADRKGLSPAQKYTIRLENNRKSANASKVFNEVLKREQASCLRRLADVDPEGAPERCARCRDAPSPDELLTARAEIARLRGVVEERAEALRMAEKQHEQQAHMRQEATNKLMDLQHEHSQQESTLRETTRTRDELRRRVDQLCDQLSVLHRRPIADGPVGNPPIAHAATAQSREHGPAANAPRPASLQQSPPSSLGIKAEEVTSSHGLGIPPIVSSTPADSQSQQENVPPQQLHLSQATTSKLVSMRPLPSFNMSLSQSDMKDFPSSINFSQSQPDDGEDKGQLMRNLPTSGGIPLLDSQPSQSDIPAFKSSVGSDDMVLSGTDYFVSSQGTTDGRSPKKARLA